MTSTDLRIRTVAVGRHSLARLLSTMWINLLGYLLPFALMIIAFHTALVAVFPPLQYFDELLVGVAFILLITHMFSLSIARIELYVFGLLAWLIAVSLVFGKAQGVGIQVVQAIIHIKLFLLYLLLRPLLKHDVALERLQRSFWITGVVISIGILLNAIIGERFVTAFGYNSMERFGTMRSVGFQLKPNDALLYLSPLLCLFVLNEALRGRRLTILLGMFAFLFLCGLNTSRTSMVSLLLATMLLPAFGRGYRLFFLLGMVMVLTAMPFILASDFVSMILQHTLQNFRELANVETSEYIRAIMMVKGFGLAVDYFPIGSGAATFGSVMSEGSHVYGEVGLYGQASFERFQGIYDSNIATLLGEFGFVGVAMFLGVTVAMFRDLARVLGAQGARLKAWHGVLSLMLFLMVMSNPFYCYIVTSSGFLIALVVGTWQLRRHHG